MSGIFSNGLLNIIGRMGDPLNLFHLGEQQQQQQQSPMSSYTPPPVPALTDPSVQAAALAQQTAAANARGRASTVMTSGLGDTSPLTTNKKTLLGA